jgi:hypothetical protein
MLVGAVLIARPEAGFAFGAFILFWSGCCISSGRRRFRLGAFIHQRLLEHANVPIELIVELFGASDLALLLCNFCLHFCTFNVPRISGAFVVVPFELKKAHDSLESVFSAGRPIAVLSARGTAGIHG